MCRKLRSKRNPLRVGVALRHLEYVTTMAYRALPLRMNLQHQWSLLRTGPAETLWVGVSSDCLFCIIVCKLFYIASSPKTSFSYTFIKGFKAPSDVIY